MSTLPLLELRGGTAVVNSDIRLKKAIAFTCNFSRQSYHRRHSNKHLVFGEDRLDLGLFWGIAAPGEFVMEERGSGGWRCFIGKVLIPRAFVDKYVNNYGSTSIRQFVYSMFMRVLTPFDGQHPCINVDFICKNCPLSLYCYHKMVLMGSFGWHNGSSYVARGPDSYKVLPNGDIELHQVSFDVNGGAVGLCHLSKTYADDGSLVVAYPRMLEKFPNVKLVLENKEG